ncbi:hypothetical protein [Streptomyces lydicamycinicus]|uniref:hypothetical protein n=1 Tax=Streptomyces lydicamycinicus TaxID=1546107 RepID=UPI003C2F892B
MTNSAYGRRPDLLPQFITDSLRKSNKLIRLLTLDENSELAKASLNRFSHAFAGVINWDGAPNVERISFADEPEGKEVLNRLLTQVADHDSSITLFWGTLDVPSATLPVDLAKMHSDELVERDLDFWLFCPKGAKLIEFRQDGYVTSALIPPTPLN